MLLFLLLISISMKVKLVTDSTSCIPKEFLDSNDVAVFEMSILDENESQNELSEIDSFDFIENFEKMDFVPTTSLTSPNDALEAFKNAVEEKYELILYPFITQKTSNQINSARVAAKRMKDEIEFNFYPTQLAGPSQAPFTIYALKMFEEKRNRHEIIDFFDKVKEYIYTIGVSRDFSTLFRTGKVKKNIRMTVLTKLLNLKPLFDVPLDEGVVGFGGGIGFGGSLKKIEKRIKEITSKNVQYDIIITHSNDLEKVGKLEKIVKEIREVNSVTIWTLPPVIVCTVGKGAVMVTMYSSYESFKT